MTNFSLEAMKSGRKWRDIFKVLKEKTVNQCGGKTSFQK